MLTFHTFKTFTTMQRYWWFIRVQELLLDNDWKSGYETESGTEMKSCPTTDNQVAWGKRGQIRQIHHKHLIMYPYKQCVQYGSYTQTHLWHGDRLLEFTQEVCLKLISDQFNSTWFVMLCLHLIFNGEIVFIKTVCIHYLVTQSFSNILTDNKLFFWF